MTVNRLHQKAFKDFEHSGKESFQSYEKHLKIVKGQTNFYVSENGQILIRRSSIMSAGYFFWGGERGWGS